ncbi:MAG: outer membrane lipid asymmetry maintenance protein MlaD [Pseudomonadota bacterium]
MKKYSRETIVGIFVLIGILCVSYLTIKLGRMEVLNDNGYTIEARFASVSGLRSGAEIQIAGVSVGRVSNISLEPESQMALVTMVINKEVQLSDDVIASVKTSGLIGDKYIQLSPGGSFDVLEDGDEVSETESAVDIEELISKYVFGGV